MIDNIVIYFRFKVGVVRTKTNDIYITAFVRSTVVSCKVKIRLFETHSISNKTVTLYMTVCKTLILFTIVY